MSDANQAPKNQESEVTPQHLHRQKLLKQEQQRKKDSKTVETFLEILNEPHNTKGGKVRLCSRKADGNLHRQYLGREKQVADLIAKYRAKGMKVVR